VEVDAHHLQYLASVIRANRVDHPIPVHFDFASHDRLSSRIPCPSLAGLVRAMPHYIIRHTNVNGVRKRFSESRFSREKQG
jgi:hypothetical protein